MAAHRRWVGGADAQLGRAHLSAPGARPAGPEPSCPPRPAHHYRLHQLQPVLQAVGVVHVPIVHAKRAERQVLQGETRAGRVGGVGQGGGDVAWACKTGLGGSQGPGAVAWGCQPRRQLRSGKAPRAGGPGVQPRGPTLRNQACWKMSSSPARCSGLGFSIPGRQRGGQAGAGMRAWAAARRPSMNGGAAVGQRSGSLRCRQLDTPLAREVPTCDRPAWIASLAWSWAQAPGYHSRSARPHPARWAPGRRSGRPPWIMSLHSGETATPGG